MKKVSLSEPGFIGLKDYQDFEGRIFFLRVPSCNFVANFLVISWQAEQKKKFSKVLTFGLSNISTEVKIKSKELSTNENKEYDYLDYDNCFFANKLPFSFIAYQTNRGKRIDGNLYPQ